MSWYDNVFLGSPDVDENQRVFEMVEEEVTDVLANAGLETITNCLMGHEIWVKAIESVIAERKNNF